jgi:hypothetical protein
VARGFLITPFSAETAGGEDTTVFTSVQEAIRAAAEETGLDLRRADGIFAAGVVIQQVRGEIEQADVVLAICSGRNANVFYELGLAEAAGKPQILIAASKVDLPFDVGHLRAQLLVPNAFLRSGFGSETANRSRLRASPRSCSSGIDVPPCRSPVCTADMAGWLGSAYLGTGCTL